ncbi:protein C2-DOMAIN ABA-RELATED 3-like [Cucurbita maxima]|uniref:Protein C2-DOMAIN ABA-RELATED 3-like n=1 Tax=Cucurbita maxima TaxID=3661 RepID=A0A6J1K8R7_CUCMA|nr:protein C2-DOMAIN ABA-RELATED 3-like [Cucurbita maxima]
MENWMGLLRIHVCRGINLAIRDVRGSDPYVILKMGKKTLKTRVVKQNTNPQWNEDLTLSIEDPNLPITMFVYDKDWFSLDDKMGDVEIDARPFMEVAKMKLNNLSNGTIIRTIEPSKSNCLSEESYIVWENGEVTQKMFVRLRNVECGEVELQLKWIDIPRSTQL